MSQKETLLSSRRKRIALLKEMIEKNPEKPLKEIIAKFCVETGIRETLAQSYYKLLIESKEITPKNEQPQ